MLKYNLHDSLIDKVNYLPDEKRVEIIIELCNWKQSNYKNFDPEILSLCIAFEEVENYELSIENYEFNSNTILEVLEIGDQKTKIIFLTEIDAETIIITAKKISYTVL